MWKRWIDSQIFPLKLLYETNKCCKLKAIAITIFKNVSNGMGTNKFLSKGKTFSFLTTFYLKPSYINFLSFLSIHSSMLLNLKQTMSKKTKFQTFSSIDVSGSKEKRLTKKLFHFSLFSFPIFWYFTTYKKVMKQCLMRCEWWWIKIYYNTINTCH